MNIIAHRGYSAKYPENTLASFQAAIDLGADMIELDVVLSSDDVPVIIHDETLNRTTNGKGPVSKLSLEQLQQLDAGSWFNSEFKNEKIPTLDQVLQLIAGKISINIEIKAEAVKKDSPTVETQVLELVKKYKMEGATIISSFLDTPLFRISKMTKDVPIAYLIDHSMTDENHHTLELLQPSAIHLAINHLKTEDMDYASVHQIPVRVYTVNNVAQMKRAPRLLCRRNFYE